MKLLLGNLEWILQTLNIARSILNISLIIQKMIARIDKFDLIKKLLHIKIITKRQHAEWRKYFPNIHQTEDGFIRYIKNWKEIKQKN